MKKIKLLTSLTALTTIGTTIGVLASCSCSNGSVTLDESVTKQGVTVKSSNITKGKESTIVLNLPSGKSISSITLVIGDTTIYTSSVTISGGKITIPANKMVAGKVTIKSITLKESTGKTTKSAFIDASKQLEAKRNASSKEYSLAQITSAKVKGEAVTPSGIVYGATGGESNASILRSAIIEYDGHTGEDGIVICGTYYTVEIFEQQYPGYFKDETTTGVTYTINSDGSVEYTNTSLTATEPGVIEWKMNQYGYFENLKVNFENQGQIELVQWEVSYDGEPTVNSKLLHFNPNQVVYPDFTISLDEYREVTENGLNLQFEVNGCQLTAPTDYDVSIKQGETTIATNTITFLPQATLTLYTFSLTAAEYAAFDPTAGDCTIEVEEQSVTQAEFMTAYNNFLTTYTSSARNYNQVIVNTDATFYGQPVLAGSLEYDQYSAVPPAYVSFAAAAWLTFAGKARSDLETYINNFDDASYKKVFTVGTDSITFKVISKTDRSQYEAITYDNNTYITKWVNTFTESSGLTNYGINLTTINYSTQSDYVSQDGLIIMTETTRALTGTVTIPTEIAGMTVTGIASSGCAGTQASEVVFQTPSNITKIGSNAFGPSYSPTWEEIPSLITSFTIPANVTIIEYGVFNGCNSCTSIYFENGDNWYQSSESTTPVVTTSETDNATNFKNSVPGFEPEPEYTGTNWGYSGLQKIEP